MGYFVCDMRVKCKCDGGCVLALIGGVCLVLYLYREKQEET